MAEGDDAVYRRSAQQTIVDWDRAVYLLLPYLIATLIRGALRPGDSGRTKMHYINALLRKPLI